MTKNERLELFLATPIANVLSPKSLNTLAQNGFFTAPASTKYHGAYEGGLFDHSYEVMQTLVNLTKDNELRWERVYSPYIIGMFHDLCKIDQYRRQPVVLMEGEMIANPEHLPWEYNPDTMFKGHGDKSIILLSQFMTLTEEEVACIRYHMGAFTSKEEWRDYTNAVHKYPNVLWTHHADMIASHVKGV